MTLTLDTHCRCWESQSLPHLGTANLQHPSFYNFQEQIIEHRNVWCWSSQLYQAKGHEPLDITQRRDMHSHSEKCLQCRASSVLSPGRVYIMCDASLITYTLPPTRRIAELLRPDGYHYPRCDWWNHWPSHATSNLSQRLVSYWLQMQPSALLHGLSYS